MKDKVYIKILVAIVTICLALTIAHTIYAVYAYQNSSIIYFITKEWW